MAIFSAPLHSPLLYSSFRHPEVTRVSQLFKLCPKWVVSECAECLDDNGSLTRRANDLQGQGTSL